MSSGISERFLSKFDWEDYKIKIIDPTIDQLNSKPAYKDNLDEIIKNTVSYTDCTHLLRYTDGPKLKKQAEESLSKLKTMLHEHNLEIKINQDKDRESQNTSSRNKELLVFSEKLDELKTKFIELSKTSDFQRRGLALEDVLHDLFILHDLNPKSSFARVGEQIDGAFTF